VLIDWFLVFNATLGNISAISNSQHQVGTDWIGSCKSNYHAITATTAPINRIRNNTELKTWRHVIGQNEQNESHWKSTIIFICGVPRENTELTQFADIHYRLQGCIEHISPRAGLDLSSLKVIRINCIRRCKVLYYHDLSGVVSSNIDRGEVVRVLHQ
jgi:hypothetical protein